MEADIVPCLFHRSNAAALALGIGDAVACHAMHDHVLTTLAPRNLGCNGNKADCKLSDYWLDHIAWGLKYINCPERDCVREIQYLRGK